MRNAGIIASAGGGGLWTPALLSPVVWFDASDLTTITKDGSDRVSQWNNKGSGGNATQATAGAKPLWVASGLISGMPALRFDGSRKMGGTLTITGQTASFLRFGTTNGAGSILGGIFEMANGAAATASHASVENCAWLRRFTTTIKTSYNQTTTTSMTWVADAPHMYYSGRDTLLMSQYLNDVLGTGGAVTAGSNMNSTMFGIGCDVIANGVLSTNMIAGDYFELLLTNTALTTLERNKLHGYIAHKWGRTSLLDGAHPYKTVAPTV